MKPDYQEISEIVESLEVIANINPDNQKELLLKHAHKLNNISNRLEKLGYSEGAAKPGAVADLMENRVKILEAILDNAKIVKNISTGRIDIDLVTKFRIIENLRESITATASL